MGLVWAVLAALLIVIYILLPVKLWRMADRIKEIRAESRKQTNALEALVKHTADLANLAINQVRVTAAMNTQLAKLVIASSDPATRKVEGNPSSE